MLKDPILQQYLPVVLNGNKDWYLWEENFVDNPS